MATPSNKEITSCLERIVRNALRSDQEITVNLARSRAEVQLGLDEGFFKDDPAWKSKSKAIIAAAVEDAERGNDDKPASPVVKAGDKRKVTNVKSTPPKRAKQRHSSDEDEKDAKDNGDSSSERGGKDKPAPDLDMKDAGSESDYSSVIDEPAPVKRKRQSKTTTTTTNGKSAQAKPVKSTAAGKDLSADEEEIKKLQGWLIKCGVRKLWHRELANCSSAKDKIKHLKGLLQEVGMTGRYSAEKARQIKEARELAEELEAAKEFNDKWGQGDGTDQEEDDDEDGSGKEGRTANKNAGGKGGRRRLPKGLVDFGDSGDDGSD